MDGCEPVPGDEAPIPTDTISAWTLFYHLFLDKVLLLGCDSVEKLLHLVLHPHLVTQLTT